VTLQPLRHDGVSVGPVVVEHEVQVVTRVGLGHALEEAQELVVTVPIEDLVGIPLFVVTHRPEDEPPDGGFTFVNGGLDDAIAGARQAAGGKDVAVEGGADVMRQALRVGHVEELSISIAPVILGGGKRPFEGFDETLKLEHVGLLQSRFATAPSPIASCAD
jgi:dihydrofolate reductase